MLIFFYLLPELPLLDLVLEGVETLPLGVALPLEIVEGLLCCIGVAEGDTELRVAGLTLLLPLRIVPEVDTPLFL